MTDLHTFTNKELVGVYNGLSPRPLKEWKGRKDVLIGRIDILRAEELSEAPEPGQSSEVAEVTGDGESDAGTTGNGPVRTIKSTSVALLCLIQFYEDRNGEFGPDNRVESDHPGARSVGLPYDEVLRRVRVQFPECETTVACLRWYSVKIRVEERGYEGLCLPQRRPRVKSTG